MENKYTLFELNEYIRRVVALNLPDALWISCEIAQLSVSKGHIFIHLVQKEENGDSIIAQSEAVIWAMDYRRLKRKFGKNLDSLLQEGMEVMIYAKVDFNERYGYKLVITDLDPVYTIGKLALQRQKVVEVLKKENLLQKNAAIPLPLVIKRVAILSSKNAAGLQDYLNQINQNQFGYVVGNQLFPTSMQGDKVELEMMTQLNLIAHLKNNFDCVIIVRGGGARLDLSAFDSLELSKAIANCSLPVITGIGHDIDETVVDKVAHSSLKTPTAVADFIIQHNLNFEIQLDELGSMVFQLVQQKIKTQELVLNHLENQFKFTAESILKEQNRLLDFIDEKIPVLLKNRVRSESEKVSSFEKICQLLSPEETLKRGFTVSLLNGKMISNSKQANEGDILETILSEGKIKSKVLSNG